MPAYALQSDRIVVSTCVYATSSAQEMQPALLRYAHASSQFLQAKNNVNEAPKAPAAPSMDLNQLQTLLQQQQQQAAQQLQAQQAARAGLWPDQATLWQLAQLQQMMQGTGQPAPHMPQCSVGGLSQDALNSLAQMQAFQNMFGQASGAPSTAAPSAATNPPPSAAAVKGCAASAPAPPQFCSGSVQLPTAPPKARKSSAKLRKHTSAAKIAKPEAVRPAAQAPVGRPDAMSMMQQM